MTITWNKLKLGTFSLNQPYPDSACIELLKFLASKKSWPMDPEAWSLLFDGGTSEDHQLLLSGLIKRAWVDLVYIRSDQLGISVSSAGKKLIP